MTEQMVLSLIYVLYHVKQYKNKSNTQNKSGGSVEFLHFNLNLRQVTLITK